MSAPTPERLTLIVEHPSNGDQLRVGGVLWTCEGRDGHAPDSKVRVSVQVGPSILERRVIRLVTWTRLARAAGASVLVDGQPYVAPSGHAPKKRKGPENLGRYRRSTKKEPAHGQ